MKWAKWIVILLLLVIVLVAVVGYIMVDQITKSGIERGGTYALGVETSVDNVSLGLFSGDLSMNNLSVANPEGFKDDHFLKLGEGHVQVTLGSLMEETVVVPTLTLSNIYMSLEKNAGKANYQVILNHLAEVTGGDKEPEPGEEGKKFIVNEIVITDVNVKAEVIGGVSVPVNIPEIRLQNVGSDTSKGVLLKDLSGIIVTAILKAVVEQAGGALPGDIGNSLRDGLTVVGDLGNFGVQVIGDVTTQAGQVVGEAAERLGESAEKVGEEAGKAVEKIGEGLGGLLGGKKEQEQPKDPEAEQQQ